MYDVHFPSNIEVEWCSLGTDVTVLPPTSGVYFHPQILALGVKLLMTLFVRGVLVYFKVPPSQLTSGAWRTVLGFEALCAAHVPALYDVEEFCAAYVMRKSHQEARFFILQSGYDRLIINLVDIDHG